jgi:hypothetical protein
MSSGRNLRQSRDLHGYVTIIPSDKKTVIIVLTVKSYGGDDDDDELASNPGFPFSNSATNSVKSRKAPERRGLGCDNVNTEVERSWVRGKNSPFSSRSMAG